jgi:outer membrane usher protein
LVGGAETPKNAAVAIHGPLGFLDLSTELAYARDSAYTSERLRFNGAASTSLAFAGGQLGISRSIGDSFAFLVPDESIGSQRVDLRPTGSASTTTSLGGRSKIIPNLTSYMKTGVGIDMPESPPDISPSVPAVVLHPTYRSGTVIKVSVKRSYFVYGRLKGADGKAVSEIYGDVFSTSGEPLGISTFTDDQGLFECYGLGPGEYSLRWGNGSISVFTLADTNDKEIDLGDLVPGPRASSGVEAEGNRP